MPDEDWTSGHQAMCQDFVDAVTANHPPRSDGRLGLEVIRTIYASHVAAATGQRVALSAS